MKPLDSVPRHSQMAFTLPKKCKNFPRRALLAPSLFFASSHQHLGQHSPWSHVGGKQTLLHQNIYFLFSNPLLKKYRTNFVGFLMCLHGEMKFFLQFPFPFYFSSKVKGIVRIQAQSNICGWENIVPLTVKFSLLPFSPKKGPRGTWLGPFQEKLKFPFPCCYRLWKISFSFSEKVFNARLVDFAFVCPKTPEFS